MTHLGFLQLLLLLLADPPGFFHPGLRLVLVDLLSLHLLRRSLKQTVTIFSSLIREIGIIGQSAGTVVRKRAEDTAGQNAHLE